MNLTSSSIRCETAIGWKPRPAAPCSVRRGDCRLGAVLLVTIVCVAVATAVMFAIVKQAVLGRREVDLERLRVQALWLAESGAGRAAARVAADPAYTGEQWLIPAKELGGPYGGCVRIEVEPAAGEPRVFQVRVIADYPDDSIERVRRSREFRIRTRS